MAEWPLRYADRMIVGINTTHDHDGISYHLQVEDLGLDAKAFEVRVYDKGNVLWLKRVSYEDMLAEDLDKTAREQAIRQRMEKTLHTVRAGIDRGKIALS